MKESHEEITQGKKSHKRFCVQGFGGPHFIRILKNTVRNAMFFKVWEIHTEGMRCLYTHKLPCRHLINEKYILLD
jgi:hypothetical protein